MAFMLEAGFLGISAWYILNNRHREFFARSLKIVLAAAIAVTPLQISDYERHRLLLGGADGLESAAMATG